MNLSNYGFFKKKAAIENRQLIEYLNLLTANLKNIYLKKLQISYLQKLSLSRLHTTPEIKKRLPTKFMLRNHKTKKRFILRNKHIETIEVFKHPLGMQQRRNNYPLFPSFVKRASKSLKEGPGIKFKP